MAQIILARILSLISTFWAKISRWVLDNSNAADNYIWIQRGVGIYFAARYGLILPNTTVLVSSHGITVPYMLDLPEPHPIFALTMVLGIIVLGGALMFRNCRPWVWWAILGLHSYLVCVGVGAMGGAFEKIGFFTVFVMALSASLKEKSWSVRVLQIYVANIYFWAGMHKLTGGVWLQGELIRRVLSVGWGGEELNFEFLPFLANWEVSLIVTRGVIIGELLVPILLFLPTKYRLIPILAAFSFHIGTTFFMGLAEFLITPICTLGFLTVADKALLAKIAPIFLRLAGRGDKKNPLP